MIRDYELENYISAFCVENGVSVNISRDMPDGYDTAYGTYDVTVNTLYLNFGKLENASEYEVLFYLFHELRHALQYLRPEMFDEQIRESSSYVVLYDGTCFKLIDHKWHRCYLDEVGNHFTDAYLSIPYEVDANRYAYQKVKIICGDSPELRKLYQFWMPKTVWQYEDYRKLFLIIDGKIMSEV